MPRRLVLPLALLGLLPVAPAWAQAEAQDRVPGELIVRFKPAADAADRTQAREAADTDLVRTMRLPRAQLLEVEPGQSVGEAVAELDARDDVAFAEPNYVYRATTTHPNDPLFGNLWGLHNTGQAFSSNGTGLADADIDWLEAYGNFVAGPSTTVTVAVADTGVAYDHPDLAANMVAGWDFVDGDNDPRDLNDHGTHVAGTIAAVRNNGVGITGVAWNVRIMPLRVLNAEGSGTSAVIADAFDYAGDNGVRVVNASLGGPGASSLIDAAISGHPETLYVVAAGNDGRDLGTSTDYPCEAPGANVVCVAASTQSDGLATFSNFGDEEADLAAPGTQTQSTVAADAYVVVNGFEGSLGGWTNGGVGGAFAATTTPTLPFDDMDPETRYPGPSEGSYVLDDQPTVDDYKSSENYWIQSPAKVGAATAKGCFLDYDIRYDFNAGTDQVLVETSPTGGAPWTARASFDGYRQSWSAEQTFLGPVNEVYVRFRVLADGTPGEFDTYDGVQIDDVRTRCIIDSYSGTEYATFQGTSMATPHVAGAAAALLAENPTATVASLRDWLLDSGNPLEVLFGKTVVGKRLNLDRALRLAAGATLDATAFTRAATSVGATTATLNGIVDPARTATQYRFEWGTTAAYGNTAPSVPAGVGSGGASVAVSQALTGLAPNQTYHYRVVPIRGGVPSGTPGADLTFTTEMASPAATPDTSGPSSPQPPPQTPPAPTTPTPPPEPPTDLEPTPPASPSATLTPRQPPGAVQMRVACASRCRVSGALTAPRWLQRLLGGTRTLAQGTTTLGAGSRVVRLTLPDRMQRRLRRAGLRTINATLTLTVTDARGQRTRSTRRVRIKLTS